MLSFCLVVSAVYVFNDIIDVEADREHPIKKNRPIASGKISIEFAWVIFSIFLLLSFALALAINVWVFLTVLSYLVLNILYSLKLKTLPLIDVACIALGFILRILCGCAAIMVIPSPLVILLTFFTYLLFLTKY